MTTPSSEPARLGTPASRELGEVIDGARFRSVLGRYPTGVVLVTGPPPFPGSPPPAMVVGTFTSVSLNPPLVGFLPAKTSTTWPRLRAAGRFCVNVLGAEHQRLCDDFARGAATRWDVPWRRARSGCPVLADALAWIDCEVDGETEAGDHWFVTGLVRRMGVLRPNPPLLFLGGAYGEFMPGPAPDGD